ncbi:MAG: hypothetical protein JO075_00180 [Acidimicrobiia bacterium]|nr:hypothetical protein [Acidimicrobiia bacterium]
MTPAADQVEAHVQRALTAADRLFEALEEIEQAGGLAYALAARKPKSRAEVVARLHSARDQLDAALRIGRPRPGRRHMNIR